MPTTKPAQTSPQPPAAAVSADAHWAAKMERLRNRNLAETTFVICDEPDVRTRYTKAVRGLELAENYLKNNPADQEAARETEQARTELEEAKAAYDEVSIPIRFRALPRQSLEALYKAHKPSEAEAEEGAEWGSAFHAALISAASVDGMTEAEARELLDSWSLVEANAMFNAAYGIQSTIRADLGKG